MPDLGHLVNRVARLMRHRLSREVSSLGLTSRQSAVLLSLGAAPGGCAPIGRMAEQLGMDRPSMSGVAERLVRDGWVETVPNPEDGRSRLMRLTDRGVGVQTGLRAIAHGVSAEALRALDAGRVRSLLDELEVIAAALEEADRD